MLIDKKQMIVEKALDLPSAPGIVQRLYGMIAKEDASSHEIAKVITTDQGFTARILRLVNSSFYGFSRKIVSVEEAIMMLGMNAVHQLLLTTSLFNSFKDANKAMNLNDFWKHSFGVGLIAKNLPSNANDEMRNEIFMCGVLHDVGRLAFMRYDPEKFCEMLYKGNEFIGLEREVEVFGYDHQQIGQLLAQKWNFPDSITTAIALHHKPHLATRYQTFVAAVNIADILSHAMGIGDSGNFYVADFQPSAWNVLELDYIRLESILRKALDEMHESERLLAEIT